MGESRDFPNFGATTNYLCKATNFKFCTHMHRIDVKKSPLKTSGKVAVGVIRDSRKF